MTLTAVTVTGSFNGPDGSPLADGTLIFRTRRWDLVGSDVVVPDTITATITDGAASIEAYASADGVNRVGFDVDVEYTSATTGRVARQSIARNLVIPNTDPVNIGDLLDDPLILSGASGLDIQLRQELRDARDQAVSAAGVAAPAAANAATSETNAANSAASAALSSASAGTASGRLEVATFPELATVFGYSSAGGRRSVAAGDLIRVVGLAGTYQVLASGASSWSLDYTGSGGVKLALLTNPATPEMLGATGGANDSAAIALWWQHGATMRLLARGSYNMASGTTPLLTLPAGRALDVDATGASFTVTAGQAHAFRVLTNAACSVRIQGIRVNCNSFASNGILVEASAGTCEVITIRNCEISNVLGLVAGYWSSSCSGIRVAATAKTLTITGNVINSVNRNYVNPGVTASQGIAVSEALNLAEISGNWISDIQSPAGDADADGIVVFSRDIASDVPQEIAVRIHNNYLRECKGRFIKLQTTEAYVHSNRFDSITKDIVASFRAVDAQFGGCRIESNYWHLRAVGGATALDDVFFVQTQMRATAKTERRTVVADNFLVLARNIRYLVSIVTSTANAGNVVVEVRDNQVQGSTSAWLYDTLIRQNGDIANFTSLRLEVQHNTYVSRRDAIVNLDQTFVTNSTAAGKASFLLSDNVNTVTPTAISSMVFLVTSGAPHINDICIRGNMVGNNTDANRLNAQSLTLAGIKPNSAFYYGTDGSTGGITDAPSGYNRFMLAQAIGNGFRLSNTAGDELFRVSPSAGWRRVASVAFP